MPDPEPNPPRAHLVPDWFEVPRRLATDDFVLVPLGAEHNESDYAAWTSSMHHIAATPGFADWGWPHPMRLEENLSDLVEHADDFEARRGFTYTVLDPTETDVIGCLYIYPLRASDGQTAIEAAAQVRSWVTAARGELDVALWRTVGDWLATTWPFTSVEYAPR
jgi:hypothetical protein